MIAGCTQQVGEYSQATVSATMNSSRPAQPYKEVTSSNKIKNLKKKIALFF